nr:immunoglobulin light chain junction region [Macaca mulatta]
DYYCQVYDSSAVFF